MVIVDFVLVRNFGNSLVSKDLSRSFPVEIALLPILSDKKTYLTVLCSLSSVRYIEIYF